jgi:hypothetical protein
MILFAMPSRAGLPGLTGATARAVTVNGAGVGGAIQLVIGRAVEITGTTVGDSIQLEQNSRGILVDGNIVQGNKENQCRNF